MGNYFSKIQKGENKVQWYLIGIFLTFAGYFLGQLPLTAVAYLSIQNNNIGSKQFEEFSRTTDFNLIGIGSNLGLVLLITMFIFAIVGLFYAVKIQKKNFKDLIFPNDSKIDVGRLAFGFGLWFGLGLVGEVISYFVSPINYVFHFEALSFFTLLIICIFLLPIQTSFEELFFRGYLMQGLALITKNKIVLMLITSVLFAAVHGANPEIKEYGIAIMLTYYITAGIFLALITIMDGRLELALGVHAATNFYGAVISSYGGGVLQTDSLLKSETINPAVMTLAFIITAIIFVYICYKKYNWRPLTYILEPINDQPNDL
ncbi:MAG TPA: CPBP family intramembrane metalloprotease [Saprospiraceae bacterium]|nr:CPBP family intramembrane metalloprotease [Saprospiraceae bacterium]